MDHPVTAVYDANILYPAPLRDLFIRLAQAGFDAAPGPVCAAVKRQCNALRNPPKTAGELLATLESQGLVQTVGRLRHFIELL